MSTQIQTKKLTFIATMLLCASLYLGHPATATEATLSERHFEISSEGATVQAEVRGVQYKFLVDPSLRNIILLSPELVKAHGVKESGIASLFSFSADVDGQKLKGKTGKLRLSIADLGEMKPRVYWFDEPVWSGVGGSLGASGFDEDRLVFVVPDHKDDEELTVRTFDLASKKDWSVKAEIDGLPVFVKIRPHYLHSRANMITTVALKDRGIARPTREQVTINREFGQSAFAQRALVRDPVEILGASFDNIVLQDTEVNVAPNVSDVDEVIVKASKNTKAKGLAPEFFLGYDFFLQCPKVVFNTQEKQVATYCRPTPANSP